MKKINIVDIIVIVLIVLMVVFVGMRIKKYNSVSDENTVSDKFEYEVKISDIRKYSVDAFAVGDVLFDSQTNNKIGTIIDITSTPYEKYIPLEDGTAQKQEVPDRYDLVLKVETDGLINDTGYYANKTIEIKVGSEKMVETLYAKSTGTIISIK